jgi:hypothetical protein
VAGGGPRRGFLTDITVDALSGKRAVPGVIHYLTY